MKQLLENWNRFVIENQEDIERVSKVFILDGDNNFLVLLRPKQSRFMPHHWDLPGGHLKKGESHDAAAVREVKEETNLDVYDLQKIGEDNTRHPVVYYITRNYSGDIMLDKTENEQFKWLNIGEIDNYNKIVPKIRDLVKQEIVG
jgi:8-oxo-dGTP pyrophosphatase MutT (NUDIX family)